MSRGAPQHLPGRQRSLEKLRKQKNQYHKEWFNTLFLYYEILSAKCVPCQGAVPRSSDFQENLVMVRCTMLGDEELGRVYHAEFFAWYAQRVG